MGLTALISTILGMLGGVLPDVMKEVRDSRNATRELEHMRVQAELQLQVAKAQSDNRMREIEANALVQEAAAFREQMRALWESTSKPTGIVWIDGFNALLRPMCTTAIILLFLVTAVPFVWSIIGDYSAGKITAETMAHVVWGSLVGESIVAVLGFLYGYRSSAKKT